MNEPALLKIERVCAELVTSGQPITFTAVEALAAEVKRHEEQLRKLTKLNHPGFHAPSGFCEPSGRPVTNWE